MEEPQVIRIKCPWCSAVLSVRMQPGIESKSVNCPVCKHKSPFTQFRRVEIAGGVVKKHESPVSGNADSESARRSVDTESDGSTQLPSWDNAVDPYVEILTTGEVFPLRMGRNIIGRRSSASHANIQISTSERMISREHIVIDVQTSFALGNKYIVSLAKEQVNPTYVGQNLLGYRDAILLNNGDIIRLPGNMIIRFVTKPKR